MGYDVAVTVQVHFTHEGVPYTQYKVIEVADGKRELQYSLEVPRVPEEHREFMNVRGWFFAQFFPEGKDERAVECFVDDLPEWDEVEKEYVKERWGSPELEAAEADLTVARALYAKPERATTMLRLGPLKDRIDEPLKEKINEIVALMESSEEKAKEYLEGWVKAAGELNDALAKAVEEEAKEYYEGWVKALRWCAEQSSGWDRCSYRIAGW